MTREAYEAGVRRIQEYILAGDAFQVVLSQRFQVPRGDVDPFDVYRALRVINPSPYMFHLEFPEAVVTGASPEVLVRLDGGEVEVRPIAGTRRRGAHRRGGRALEAELRADPKERAEHVMLIDLGRNDVGRVSAPGTVRVDEQMVVERYSHVMHLTSHVRGRGAPGMRPADVLRAAFPAGTLSGAPKIRAMEIIEELEPSRRGIYGGAVGYVSYTGNLDLAIAIRTLVTKRRHDLRAGGRGHRRRQRPGAGVRGVRQQGARGGQRGRDRAARVAATDGRQALMLLVIDNYDSFTYNLVQYLGELGQEVRVVRNDEIAGGRRSPALAPDAHRDLAGPVHAERGRHLAGRHQELRGQDPDPRRLPRATSRSGRRSAARSCARRASCTARPRRSSTTSKGVFAGCRTRSRRRATTRW